MDAVVHMGAILSHGGPDCWDFCPAQFPQPTSDGGRSLVNKETAVAHLIGQPLGGWSRQNRMLGKREVRQTSCCSSSGQMPCLSSPGQTR